MYLTPERAILLRTEATNFFYCLGRLILIDNNVYAMELVASEVAPKRPSLQLQKPYLWAVNDRYKFKSHIANDLRRQRFICNRNFMNMRRHGLNCISTRSAIVADKHRITVIRT